MNWFEVLKSGEEYTFETLFQLISNILRALEKHNLRDSEEWELFLDMLDGEIAGYNEGYDRHTPYAKNALLKIRDEVDFLMTNFPSKKGLEEINTLVLADMQILESWEKLQEKLQ